MLGAQRSSGLGPGYTNVVFADGFESGTLANWNGTLGTGSATVSSAAAHNGANGLRLTNAAGEFQVVVKALDTPLPDSSAKFWIRLGSGSGYQVVAQARDGSSSSHMWDLAYMGSQQAFYFYPYSSAGSVELFTGSNSVPANTWVEVEVQYTAALDGGAQLYINGATQTGWGVRGDYRRSADLQRLQLWNDGAITTDFDDVTVAVPAGVPTPPGAPTGVTGTAGDGSVALSWAAPASDGGGAISSYRITPSIGGVQQTPVTTGTAATSHTLTGLTNGTAYTFTVAAINAAGPGPDSAASAPVTPAALTAPGPPTGVSGVPGDASVALAWAAPASNGGSPITGYRITPYIGANAQAPIATGSAATSHTVTGLSNGTAYTFLVAATNTLGTGPDSTASASLTPRVGYTNVVFSDGFESGSLSAWNGTPGSGSASVTAAAARTGGFGLRLTNATGQFQFAVKALPSPLVDSSASFWVRVGSAAGFETVAQALDGSSSLHMWDVYYDAARRGFVFIPFSGSGSTEIFTGVDSAPVGGWSKIEIQYTATASGGARIYLNGTTQPGWGVSGNFVRTANLQRLQLWNDVVNTTDFDDVSVATRPVPGPPTAVAGAPGNGSVALAWAAPAADGGSPITGYTVTPYVAGSPQPPISTGSTATSHTVTGLTNGTAYTFTVAASNVNGVGTESAASAPVTPAAAPTAPGAPTAVTGFAGDGSVMLNWTPPASSGGSAITGYRITPYIGSTAQAPVLTGTASASYTVTGLTNGITYRFVVAAINAVGTGPDSAASGDLTPRAGYTNVVFADGFESGSLSAWNGTSGTGSTSVSAAAARAGAFGFRMTNGAGQYSFTSKALASPLVDSSTTLWVRISAAAGLQLVAQARDSSSSSNMWDLYYDGGRQGFVLLAYRDSGASEVFTGTNSASPGAWVKLEVQYTATSSGGARLLMNGTTQLGWGVSGNYARTTNLQRIQLWSDAANTTDVDDVRVATLLPPGATVPGAPTGVTGISRDGAVALTWTPPADGGSPINAYRVTPYVNGVAQTPRVTDYPVTSYTVTGLTNNTAYTFRVAAINGAGTGPNSAASASVTPRVATVPGRPTAVTGTPRDSSIDLRWTAPSSDGGTDITGYRITPFIGANAQPVIMTGSAATSQSITGLTNNTAYTFTVAAINSIGTGAPSTPSAPITPRVALSEYTNLIFTDGFESGGLTNWNGTQGTGTAAVVAGAARTGAYGLRVAGTQGSQYMVVSKALLSPLVDSAVTFWVRPGAGQGVATIAQARDAGSSAYMWELDYDANRGGFIFFPYRSSGSTEIFTGNKSINPNVWVKVVVQYTATSPGGAQLFVDGQTKPGWGVTGDYTRATNLQRLQLWSTGNNMFDFDDVAVSAVPPPGVTPPGAPTGVTASPLDRSVALSWTAPASDGGDPVNGYQITPYVGTTAQAPVLTGSSATSFVVAGLTNGTSYTFTVAARNAAGPGPPSSPSAAVTPVPAPPPSAPTNVTGTPGNASVALTWTAPASNGGSPITSYTITPRINGTPQTPIVTGSPGTSRTVTGLTNGTAYTFTVAATNASGTGTASAPSAPITPMLPTVPGAPTNVTGSPRNQGAALNWVTPASDGGSPITSYRITPYIGSTAQTPVTTGSSATGHTVTGLTNGTAYTFRVAAINSVGTGPLSAASAPITPAVPPANPIVLENQNPGTTSWQFTEDRKAENHEIEGYASLTSVNKGSPIRFMVSLSSSAQYTMDIYRMGWYPTGTNPDGTSCAPSCGGRLMQHVGPLNGTLQARCPQVTTATDPTFGLTECQWTTSYTLNVPASWTTGNYVVKLRRLDAPNRENYMTFVVRDDSSTAPLVYSMDVTTWQAYNFWGGSLNGNVGYDLYARFNDLTGVNNGNRAYTVSFDRPYQGEGSSDGAGLFFNWDYPLVRWMESKGYDISYVTNVDMETNQNLLAVHRAFVNTGHDEYYSDAMRTTIQNGIAGGADMAFFSANNFYFRITWAPNSSGAPYRRIFSDKNALPGSTTYQYRLLTPPRPENILGGVMLAGVASDRPFRVSDASSWIYAGTGLKNWTAAAGVITSGPNQNSLPGIVGYEFDARASTSPSLSEYASYDPPGLQTVAHSLVPAADGNATDVYHDAVLYTAPSGATVFSAGTIQWSWGLDNGYNSGFCSCGHNDVNAATQRVTENILNRFSEP